MQLGDKRRLTNSLVTAATGNKELQIDMTSLDAKCCCGVRSQKNSGPQPSRDFDMRQVFSRRKEYIG